eukprot:snap_masked-scaffold_66-processed-gene-0.30-mRNA-1 protein AED:0.46 eAED:0.50 QI:0/-1/0/1/-1/1/1/0/229
MIDQRGPRGANEDSLFSKRALQWIDDLLIYASSRNKCKSFLSQFLNQCIKVNFRLNLDKCDLIKSKVGWCGRILENGRWRYDEKYFLKLKDMGEVRKIGQLEDLVYVSIWLALSVPDSARKRHYLSKRMKELERDLKIKYKKKPNKHQRRAASVEEWWSVEDQDEVRKFLKSISSSAANSLKLYQLDRRVAIFTDASFQFWSGVVGLWDACGWLPIYFGSEMFVGNSIH